MMFPKSINIRVNNCDFNYVQNNCDYYFCHNQAAIIYINIFLFLYWGGTFSVVVIDIEKGFCVPFLKRKVNLYSCY